MVECHSKASFQPFELPSGAVLTPTYLAGSQKITPSFRHLRLDPMHICNIYLLFAVREIQIVVLLLV